MRGALLSRAQACHCVFWKRNTLGFPSVLPGQPDPLNMASLGDWPSHSGYQKLSSRGWNMLPFTVNQGGN